MPADSLPLKAGAGLDLLAGVRVLDLTTSIAGPYAGQLLGDLGATVIKIERPQRGDDCRDWGPPFLDGESLWYLSVNRNKHSVTLDISQPRGRELFASMAGKADVVLVNLVSRAQRKLGIDYATLRAHRHDLIHVSITGFGLEGERADLPCYDLIAEGYSGVMDMTGEREMPPQKIGTPAADLLAGQDAALAVTAALLRRHRTGQGAQIDVALVDSMTRFMAPRLLPYLGSGELLRRSGGRDSVIAIYQAFDTADEPLTLGLGNDGIWRRFAEAVGAPELANDAGFGSNVLRRQQRAELVKRIAVLLKQQPRAYWLEKFAQARVPAGPINRLDEVACDGALQARGLLYVFDRNSVRVPQVGLGIAIDGRSEGGNKPPPKLGEDTSSVLGEWLGLADEQIADLKRTQVI
ncbi:CaiB/BaiF CoA transferase family protein [Steroidobacter flavus]|uniref:CaiB/BaiF CoA transferase family protein n=1 Tax=Steroidobacter flavus TaxID=1842136 RepID=A0ABV8T0Y5_9GAMM